MGADLVVFLVACVVVAASPGPAVLYIVARTLDQGTAAGLISMAGITTGGLLHVALTAVGVAALARAWPASLTVLQVVGALYLIWLGIERIRRLRVLGQGEVTVGHQALGAIYRQGVIVNVLNPKTALFMFAFLPQFVTEGGGPVWQQMGVLGLTFILIASASDGLYALAAGALRGWLKHGGTPRWPGLLAAGVYLALGGLGLADAAFGLAPS